MSSGMKFGLGLVLLLVLILLTNLIKHEPIEDKLTARGANALSKAGIEWADVSVDGRNATVKGVAPSQEAGDEAVNILKKITGIHSASGDFDFQEVVEPFLWLMTTGPDAVVMSGVVPSEEAREKLIDAAKSRFPDISIDDRMRVAAGAPIGDWAATALLGVSQLAQLDSGKVQLKDTVLRVEGVTAETAVASGISDAVAGLAKGYTGAADITVNLPDVTPALPETPTNETPAPVVIVPEEAQAEIDLCQSKIDEIMSGQTINFRTGSAEVIPQPNPLIMELAGVAKECPSTRIDIAGHTDTVGDPQANLILSKARAQAVVNLLIDQGVPDTRLAADGFGSSKPIADNSTPEGRAENRRIEFKVLYGG